MSGTEPLPLALRRQQEELARWRKLEGSALNARTNSRPSSATRRPPSTPRREVAELQALVMERRELMARQRSARGEATARSMALVRDAQSRDASPPPRPATGSASTTGGSTAVEAAKATAPTMREQSPPQAGEEEFATGAPPVRATARAAWEAPTGTGRHPAAGSASPTRVSHTRLPTTVSALTAPH